MIASNLNEVACNSGMRCVFLLSRPLTTSAGQARKIKGQKSSHSKKSASSARHSQVLRDELLKEENERNSGHLYKTLYPWRTRADLAEHLKSTEVYNQGGLIALCKPYGVGQVGSDGAKGKAGAVELGASGSILPNDLPGVADVIPDLRRLYGEPKLQVIKSTEKWSSGLMLLSASPQLTESVRQCWQHSRMAQEAQYTYWAVTVGLPKPVSGATKAAVKLEYVNNIGLLPVVAKDYTKASIKRNETKLTVVEHQALSYNENTDAALVQVSVQMQRHYFLRLWLAHCYSPVLGDSLYSCRVTTIAGRKIQVGPHNLSGYQQQVIPEALYTKLKLPPRRMELIPCHLHLAKIKLNKLTIDLPDLTISAPPPEHFMWTCHQLGLMSAEGDGQKIEQ